jgi:hypothetical protein
MIVAMRSLAFFVGVALLTGCGSAEGDPVQKSESYQTLVKAEEAFEAKRYAEALPGFDETIRVGLVQSDVLAETFVKRAVCKIETGDFEGASEDLAQAERGGAVGEEYQQAQKRLGVKRSRS